MIIQNINDVNFLANILHNRSDPEMFKISQAGLVLRSTACSEQVTPAANTCSTDTPLLQQTLNLPTVSIFVSQRNVTKLDEIKHMVFTMHDTIHHTSYCLNKHLLVAFVALY